ncbi:eukaryotic translation initiation factor 4 gamma 1 isoform X1 [Paramuricea clavata]|uniref:Eukaryotic translation initiation factor 4 gamma 1 isoform X1 n=1 Tax=Paramuricea clavata TaxID=317549 RepID=A0A6S7JK99_PARCT|nr:eukaryotic translation initiation factor 4 gamma 1 isoform X1 [Paramuricea clavata]
MHDCVLKLLRAGDEESLESMCKLLFTIGEDLDSDKAKPRMDQYFDQINRIIIAEKVSSRVIFMLRDVVELRQNEWVARREGHYNPKTIEAQIEKMQEQRLAVQFPVMNKKQKQGGPGGRDSFTGTSNDGWITTGKSAKSVLIEQTKLWNMAKRSHMNEISRSRNSLQEQDQPQGNSGGDMPSNRSYDPRTSSSVGIRPPLLGLWPGSDESRIKSDKDRQNTLEEFVEDMDEESGDVIKVERENYTESAAPVKQSRRKYERDFLLQFQYMPVCLTKPAGLPDIEIVLDAPAPPSKGGGSQRGGSDFSPFVVPRQKKQGRRGKRQPPTIIAADPLWHSVNYRA